MGSVNCAYNLWADAVPNISQSPAVKEGEAVIRLCISRLLFGLGQGTLTSLTIWKAFCLRCHMQLQDPPLSQPFDHILGSLAYQV